MSFERFSSRQCKLIIENSHWADGSPIAEEDKKAARRELERRKPKTVAIKPFLTSPDARSAPKEG